MVKKATFVLMIALLGLVLFHARPVALAAPHIQSNTPTPVAEAEAEGAEADGEEAGAAEAPALAELLARVEALESQVAALTEADRAEAAVPVDQANQVNTALYLLDNAGLHDLDVRLNQEGEILPGDSGAIARIARLLSTVDWPDALQADAQALHGVLNDLSSALADDDLAAAASLALQAHEDGHDLSHNAEHWIEHAMEGGLDDDQDAGAQANRVNTAIYLLDGAGLHDLDVRLNEEGAIEPGDAGTVAQVARLLATVDWPEALQADAEALIGVLDALSAALADDDVDTAAPLATEAHEVQHDLSHAAEHWLGERMGAHASDADDQDGHDDQEKVESEEQESSGSGTGG